MPARLLLWMAACILFAAPPAWAQTAAAPAERPAPTLLWPNGDSKANSDDWIRLHHDEIRQMQPRVLVLNFANGVDEAEATRKVERVMAGLREASRYHGYKDRSATPFLDYKLYKLVNLTDAQPPSDEAQLDGNSTLYPRIEDAKDGQPNFHYGALFGEEFARHYAVPNPANPARMLTLAEMVNQGLVHEVWFLARQGRFGFPFEVVELKQAYDGSLRKIPNKSVQAGRGASDEQPWVGRSLRIVFVNAERGPGAALTGLGHAWESLADSRAVPYLTRYFGEYAGWDIRRRFQLPFDRLGEREGAQFDFPQTGLLKFRFRNEDYAIQNYVPLGGSVNFMPSARQDFDLDNPQTVLSKIEHYRQFDGPGGKDAAEPWTNAKFARYRQLATDGVGPWLVYWWQNMPGLANRSKDLDAKPMKNWWPFLFY